MREEGCTVNRFNQLDQNMQEMLSKLEPEEVENLKYLATIPGDELRGAVKLYRDVMTVSHFMKWLIVTIVAVFIGAVSLGEHVMKLFGWMKGPPSP
ncbi:MAG: hypothetical protein J0H18_11225 [Rhizobiales bacterium]|nr:hypothetical protein [Hyphomicrobiales bacterium]OJY06696.1 MAG: hypothetical protein BGP07_16795 [Rhizobiales bacterium 63-22]